MLKLNLKQNTFLSSKKAETVSGNRYKKSPIIAVICDYVDSLQNGISAVLQTCLTS